MEGRGGGGGEKRTPNIMRGEKKMIYCCYLNCMNRKKTRPQN